MSASEKRLFSAVRSVVDSARIANISVFGGRHGPYVANCKVISCAKEFDLVQTRPARWRGVDVGHIQHKQALLQSGRKLHRRSSKRAEMRATKQGRLRCTGRRAGGTGLAAPMGPGERERRDRTGVVARGVATKTVLAWKPIGRVGGWEPTDGAEHACGGVDVGVRKGGRFPARAAQT